MDDRSSLEAKKNEKLLQDHLAYLNSLDDLPSGWISSTLPTKLRSNGKYRRPYEDPPIAGYLWNTMYGVWVPSARLLQETSMMSKATSRKVPTTTISRSKPPPSIINETQVVAASVPSSSNNKVHTRPTTPLPPTEEKMSAIRKRDFAKVATTTEELPSLSSNKKARKLKKEESAVKVRDPVEEEPAIENNASEKRTYTTATSKSEQKPRAELTHQNIKVVGGEGDDDDMFHPNSMWEEPYIEDSQLTLYERHRMPRPAPTGTILCSMDAIRLEIRCVICLDILRNTHIVRECLHRFCESCIEKALTHQNIEGIGGRRKECPICRIYLPSRRSLAPDAQFDTLISGLLDNLIWEDEDDSKIYLKLKADVTKLVKNDSVTQNNETNVEDDTNNVLLVEDQRKHLEIATLKDQMVSSLQQKEEAIVEPVAVPGLVKILLIQRRESTTSKEYFDDLKQPYITIASDATGLIIKKFLCRKHGFYYSNNHFAEDTNDAKVKSLQIQQKVGCRINNILLWTMYQEKPYIVKPTDTLRFLCSNRTDPFHGRYMPIYYRRCTR